MLNAGALTNNALEIRNRSLEAVRCLPAKGLIWVRLLRVDGGVGVWRRPAGRFVPVNRRGEACLVGGGFVVSLSATPFHLATSSASGGAKSVPEQAARAPEACRCFSALRRFCYAPLSF